MKPYVIIADDDADDREIMQLALDDIAFPLETMFLDDGSQVISHLLSTAQLPEIIILDINMPLLSGLEVLKFIRAQQRFDKVPVYILSTSPEDFAAVDCYRLGANSYTTKPDTYQAVKDWLQSIARMYKSHLLS